MKLKLFIITLSIFALSSCYEDDLYPAPNFSTTGFVPGFKWVLDATGTVSTNGQTLQYRWDYDEDQSQFDTPWLTDPVFIADGKSKTNYIKIVTLQVKDQDGKISKVSKEVHRKGFLYNFQHDTLRMYQSEIPYNTYNWYSESKTQGGDWTRNNALFKSSSNVTNLNDSLLNGSYIDWQSAKTLKIENPLFILPTKENWQSAIKMIFGDELAGFNLQVNNMYGMGLGLHGYLENNVHTYSNEKGYYWTATEADNDHAWALEIVKNSDAVRFVSLPKNYMCKVRFINPVTYN